MFQTTNQYGKSTQIHGMVYHLFMYNLNIVLDESICNATTYRLVGLSFLSGQLYRISSFSSTHMTFRWLNHKL